MAKFSKDDIVKAKKGRQAPGKKKAMQLAYGPVPVARGKRSYKRKAKCHLTDADRTNGRALHQTRMHVVTIGSLEEAAKHAGCTVRVLRWYLEGKRFFTQPALDKLRLFAAVARAERKAGLRKCEVEKFWEKAQADKTQAAATSKGVWVVTYKKPKQTSFEDRLAAIEKRLDKLCLGFSKYK